MTDPASPPTTGQQPPSYEPGSAPAPAAPRPDSASVWEDFIDIVHDPAAVFARREHGSAWIPTIVVTVLIGGLFFATSGVLQPMMDAEFARATRAAMEANPQLTPEMMDRGRGFATLMSHVGAFIFVPIAIALMGLALWVAGKFVDARQSLHAAFVVAAYSYVPKVIETVLGGVQGLLLDPAQMDGRYRLTLGVGRFLDPDTTSPVLLALLGRVDLFTLWVTVLLAIGLAVTGRIPRGRAAIAAAIVWVAGALPGLFGALRS
jgi:hypothetical protein